MLDRSCEDVYTFGKVDGIESRRMSKKEVERTIARLYAMRAMGRASVLFRALSGKLLEGIDYSANLLSASVCVGLHLTPLTARQAAFLEY